MGLHLRGVSVGLFVSFEGGEGAGKSTQAQLLRDRLAAEGYKVLEVREPGGTDLGIHLREYLKSTSKPLTAEAELFLFAAARSELVRTSVMPALEVGVAVVADRYADSTTAYQGYGRKVPMKYVRSANELATGGLWPDLTVLLDMAPELGLDRARVTPMDQRHAGRVEELGARRFEEASLAFHRRVSQGFLKLAQREPQRWLVLEATQSVDAVAAQVWERVARLGGFRSSVATSGLRRLPGL